MRAHTVVALQTLILTTVVLIAGEATVTLEKLFRVTDLVVVGTLGDFQVERTSFTGELQSTHGGERRVVENGTMQKHQATIDVQEVLWGAGCSGKCLSLKWVSDDYLLGPPIVDFTMYKDRRVILFLTRQQDGSVSVNAPAGVVELQHRSRVEGLLGRLPVHFVCRNAYSAGAAVQVTLQLTNSTDKPMVLPGVKVDTNQLVLAPQLRLRLQKNPEQGQWLEPLPQAVVFRPLPDIVLEPGETRSFELVLDRLFPIKEQGFHAVVLDIERFPPQNPGLFLYFP